MVNAVAIEWLSVLKCIIYYTYIKKNPFARRGGGRLHTLKFIFSYNMIGTLLQEFLLVESKIGTSPMYERVEFKGGKPTSF